MTFSHRVNCGLSVHRTLADRFRFAIQLQFYWVDLMNKHNTKPTQPSTLQKIAFKLAAPTDPVDHLLWLLRGEMTHEPHVLDGTIWAARPQAWWCAQLGISDRTLRRYLKKPPFQSTAAHVYGSKMTLIRAGVPIPASKRQVQRHLMNIWRKRVKEPSRRDYGLMGGLVDDWGIECAPSILNLVIDKWPAFMAGAKIEVEKLADNGHVKFFAFPTLTFIRRFANVGLELHLMQQQEKVALKGGMLSGQQLALHPISWVS